METAKRSIVKAVIWNMIGLASMAGIGFLVTGSLVLGGGMALVNTAIGFTMYVFYERIWAGIGWGRHV